jgi:hypothetical protein
VIYARVLKLGDEVLDVVESDKAFVLNVEESVDVAGRAFSWLVAGVLFVLVLDAGDYLDEVVCDFGLYELGEDCS